MNPRLGALLAPAKALDGLRPHHAEGAQLGNLKEVAGAHGKRERDRCRGAIHVHFASLHPGQEIDPRRKGESHFLGSGPARLRKPLGLNRERNEHRRSSRNNFRREIQVGQRIPSGRNRRRPLPPLQLLHDQAKQRLPGICEMHRNLIEAGKKSSQVLRLADRCIRERNLLGSGVDCAVRSLVCLHQIGSVYFFPDSPVAG